MSIGKPYDMNWWDGNMSCAVLCGNTGEIGILRVGMGAWGRIMSLAKRQVVGTLVTLSGYWKILVGVGDKPPSEIDSGHGSYGKYM